MDDFSDLISFVVDGPIIFIIIAWVIYRFVKKAGANAKKAQQDGKLVGNAQARTNQRRESRDGRQQRMLDLLQKRLEEAGESVERNFNLDTGERVVAQPPKEAPKQTKRSSGRSLISKQSQSSLVSNKSGKARSIEQMMDEGGSNAFTESPKGGSISFTEPSYSSDLLDKDAATYDSPIFQAPAKIAKADLTKIDEAQATLGRSSMNPIAAGLFEDPSSLRRAVLLKEIFDKPKALRHL